MYEFIDLTHTITDRMPIHPFDEPVLLKKTRYLTEDKYNDWKLCAGMHIGTHIDGPGHMTDSQTLLSDLPVDRFVGKGYLVDARNVNTIDAIMLKGMPTQKELVVLVLTGWDKKFGSAEYFDDHPVMTSDFAEELVKRNVKMVGIDFFSPDKPPFTVHHIFFDHNILLIENLTNLDRFQSVEEFTVIALPIKTVTDSALARVIAVVG